MGARGTPCVHTIRFVIRRSIASAGLLAALLLAGAVPFAHAAGGTYYVDGKSGSDSNGGRSAGDAFKTIRKAAVELDKLGSQAGWTVVVKGYSDYVYRERPIPEGWSGAGASGAPVVFQAAGYEPGSLANYTKPIVSGADAAPRSGEKWVSHASGIWKTPWPDKPFGYGSYSGSLRTALFQDRTTWLWEQSSLSALADRAAAGKGGYVWSGGWLYASAIGNKDPGAHAIDVVTRNAFLFIGTEGVKHVEVRGFEVRHAANGIAFVKGVDYATAADNVLTGNLLMGIQTSGAAPSNAAKYITLGRNRGSYNTLQFIKIDEGTQNANVFDNAATRNGLQGIKVQGPPGGTGYTGTTSGITVFRNYLYYNDYNPSGSAYTNTSGLTISNGAKSVVVESNRIHHNRVGIHIAQESSGRADMTGIALKRNHVYDNVRFGINFYDGAKGASAGDGAMRSDYDILWGNGIGIMVSGGSSNKTISHATIHDNDGDGVRVGESGKAAASVTFNDSLITGNGGYGMWLVTGNKATVRYTGIHGNGDGSIKGSPSKTAVNTKAPDYVSTSPSSSGYLRISSSSYQYTAGPNKTPIGARW